MPDEPLSGSLRFPRPSWRVVRVQWQGPRGWDGLEAELRKRHRDYDLVFVTQQGDLYTLFLRAKPETMTRRNGRERVLRENSHEREKEVPER